MNYFSLTEAAKRYDAYRPKVHHIISTWLKDAGVTQKFKNSLDVACGTGDSTLPLIDLSDHVIGIDLSKSMIERAELKGLSVKQAGYEKAHELGRFDLITTCMAFHWFDFDEALKAYQKASSDNAIWLIYNFSFGGSESSEEFNDWFVSTYLKKFPSPARNANVANFDGVDGVKCLASDKGVLPIQFADKKELVKYLTTQSNVENAVKAGSTYSDIEKEIEVMLQGFDLGTEFRYKYTYDLYQFTAN